MSATVEAGKQMIRQQVQAELGELDAALRLEHPEMEASERQALSEQRKPELHRYSRAIETGEAWRKPPIYRYVDKGGDTVRTPSLREAAGLPVRVEADHAERLHDATQKLVNKTPGLH